VRYEYYSPVTPRYKGGASNYDPTTNTLLIAGYGDVNLATGVDAQALNLAPRFGFAYRLSNRQVIRGGYGISYWTGRFGFTGGTLSTQFPTIFNVQQGNTGDFIVDGAFTTLPVVQFVTIPDNGRIAPAPNQGFFVIPPRNRLPYVQNYNFTYQRDLGHDIVFAFGSAAIPGSSFNRLNAAAPGTGDHSTAVGHSADVIFLATGSVATATSADELRETLFARRHLHIAYAYSKSLDVGNDQYSPTISIRNANTALQLD
jgi:hypothetical protein